MALTAPPVEGAANKALVGFVAKVMGISKASVRLVRGDKSREKTLELSGVAVSDVRAKIGVEVDDVPRGRR